MEGSSIAADASAGFQWSPPALEEGRPHSLGVMMILAEMGDWWTLQQYADEERRGIETIGGSAGAAALAAFEEGARRAIDYEAANGQGCLINWDHPVMQAVARRVRLRPGNQRRRGARATGLRPRRKDDASALAASAASAGDE